MQSVPCKASSERTKENVLDDSRAVDWTAVVNYARRSYSEPPKTQYELPGVNVEDHLGVPVACIPLWHTIVTARLTIGKGDVSGLRRAQARLGAALTEIEATYPLNPGGIFTQVAYGLPYFKDYIPASITEKFMTGVLDLG